MAENKNDTLVIAFYVNTSAAKAVANDLKDWDKANDDIKLGAIGVITLDEETGKVRVDEVGERKTGKGAMWGTAIGAGLGILTAGIALIPGMLVGAAVGAGAGALDHKSLGMSDDDAYQMANNLKNGGAALGVMCDSFEVAATKAKMIAEGGTVDHWAVPEETGEALAATAAAQADATDAVDAAAAELADVEVDLPGCADAGKAAAVGTIAAAGGLDAADAAKLHDAGVEQASALLAQGATPQGRAELAEATGIDEATILAAVKKMDLMRIDGVGVVYANLLQASGVETVPDLARRNAANLAKKLADVNASAGISDALPTEEVVTGWVSQAKELPRMIVY